MLNVVLFMHFLLVVTFVDNHSFSFSAPDVDETEGCREGQKGVFCLRSSYGDTGDPQSRSCATEREELQRSNLQRRRRLQIQIYISEPTIKDQHGSGFQNSPEH